MYSLFQYGTEYGILLLVIMHSNTKCLNYPIPGSIFNWPHPCSLITSSSISWSQHRNSDSCFACTDLTDSQLCQVPTQQDYWMAFSVTLDVINIYPLPHSNQPHCCSECIDGVCHIAIRLIWVRASLYARPETSCRGLWWGGRKTEEVRWSAVNQHCEELAILRAVPFASARGTIGFLA